MSRLIAVIITLILFVGCDPSVSVSVDEEPQGKPPDLESGKAAAQARGVNPRYVDFERMYETGQHDVLRIISDCT